MSSIKDLFAIKRAALAAWREAHGCKDCGTRKNLLFHHPNDDKKFRVSAGLRYGWDRIAAEVAKCIVLCQPCHGIRHWYDCAIGGVPSR